MIIAMGRMQMSSRRESVDAVGAERRLIVDGPLVMEPLYGRLPAALRPGSEVLLS